MASWRDISSFSQTDTVREPNCFELNLGGAIRLRVHRHRAYRPDQWVVTFGAWFDSHLLDATDLVQAQMEAARLVTNRLNAVKRELKEATDSLKQGKA